MRDRSYAWLDAISDGRIMRDWLALFVNFFFSIAYLTFLIGGFAIASSLSFVLIGLPLLLFMLTSTRTLAALDRKVTAAILGIDEPDTFDDVDPRGANLGERLGMYLGSSVTWRSLIYLVAKLPISIMAFIMSMLILLPLAIEVLILAPLTIDLHLISVRLMHWSAVGLHRLNTLLLPDAKYKRRVSRLELVETPVEEEERYFLEDDGEIGVYKRKA